MSTPKSAKPHCYKCQKKPARKVRGYASVFCSVACAADWATAMCTCGHPFIAHHAGTQGNPCMVGMLDDTLPRCACAGFHPVGRRN